MINTLKITPSIYSKESRDYQLIGRLYNAVFNYVKMSTDAMYNLPLSANSDTRFLDLVAKTLGFESKHNYNIENLFALCTSFKTILRHKGTKQAIEELVNVLINSQNIQKLFTVDVYAGTSSEPFKPYTVVIKVPVELKDIIMIEDVMNYILPAGFTYEIYTIDIDESSVYSTFTAESSQITIEGTSQQFSRIDSYINSSLVTGLPVDTSEVSDVGDAKSGKAYIDEKKGGEWHEHK